MLTSVFVDSGGECGQKWYEHHHLVSYYNILIWMYIGFEANGIKMQHILINIFFFLFHE